MLRNLREHHKSFVHVMLKNFDIWLFSLCILMKRYICPVYYDLEWQTKSFPHLLVSSFNAIYISSSSYRIISAWSCNPFVIPLTPSALLTQETTLATWQPRWVIICIMNLIYVTQRHFTMLRSHVTRDDVFIWGTKPWDHCPPPSSQSAFLHREREGKNCKSSRQMVLNDLWAKSREKAVFCELAKWLWQNVAIVYYPCTIC